MCYHRFGFWNPGRKRAELIPIMHGMRIDVSIYIGSIILYGNRRTVSEFIVSVHLGDFVSGILFFSIMKFLLDFWF